MYHEALKLLTKGEGTEVTESCSNKLRDKEQEYLLDKPSRIVSDHSKV